MLGVEKCSAPSVHKVRESLKFATCSTCNILNISNCMEVNICYLQSCNLPCTIWHYQIKISLSQRQPAARTALATSAHLPSLSCSLALNGHPRGAGVVFLHFLPAVRRYCRRLAAYRLPASSRRAKLQLWQIVNGK